MPSGPQLVVVCFSRRTPISFDRSSKSRAEDTPPRMIFTIAASHNALPSCSPHTARA